jgi:iron(III) transport system permease protein
LAWVAGAALVYLIGAPLIMTLMTAFRGPADYLPFEEGSRFTLENVEAVYTSAYFWSTLFDTTWFVLGSTAIAFVVAFTLAFLVERTNMPGRGIVFVLLTVPIMIPPLIHGLAWIFLLGRSGGLLNVLIRAVTRREGPGPFDVFTWYGMLTAQSLALVPLMFLLLGGALRRMDPALEEASLVAGNGWPATLRRVTLPTLRPAVLSVLILASIITLESLDIPLTLGVGAGARVLATAVYYPLSPQAGLPRYGEVAALALSFLALTYALVALYGRATRHAARFATIGGKAFRPRAIDLRRWRLVIVAGVIGYLCLQVFFPAFVLVWTSLLDGYRPPTDRTLLNRLSLAAFRNIADDPRFGLAFRNTVLVATLSASLITALAALTAWIVVRGRHRARWALDFLASSSIGLPSVIAGVGFLMFYLAMPGIRSLGLYGTVWLLVLASSYRTTVGFRTSCAGIMQIKAELEEAAAVAGAARLTVMRRIVVPLLMPTLLAVWLLAFIVVFRELTLPLVLGSADNVMIGPLLWRYVSSGEMGRAAALAVVMVVMLAAVGLLARRLTGVRLEST